MKNNNKKIGFVLIGLGLLLLSIIIYVAYSNNSPEKAKAPVEKSTQEKKIKEEKKEDVKKIKIKEKKNKKEVVVDHHTKSALYETCVPTNFDRYPEKSEVLEINTSSYVYGKPDKWIEVKIRENVRDLGLSYSDAKWEIEGVDGKEIETKIEEGVLTKMGDTNKKFRQSALKFKTSELGEYEITVRLKVKGKVVSDSTTVIVREKTAPETRTTELFKVVEKDSDGDYIDDEFDEYPESPAKKVVYPVGDFVTQSRYPCIAIEGKEYNVYGWNYSENVEEHVVVIKTNDEVYNIRPFKGFKSGVWITYPTFKDSSYAVVLDDEIAWSKATIDGKGRDEAYIEENHSISILPNKKEIFISGGNLTKETVSFYIGGKELKTREVSDSDMYTYWVGDKRKVNRPEGIYIKVKDFPSNGIITAKINGKTVKEFPFAFMDL